MAINTILSKRGLMDLKKGMMLQASEGRTDHSSELYFEEAHQLLVALNTSQPTTNTLMLRKLFAMAFEMGMIEARMMVSAKMEPQQQTNYNIQTKNDYGRLYAWVNKYGYLKKELRAYSYEELPKLLSQFEFGPYKDFLNK